MAGAGKRPVLAAGSGLVVVLVVAAAIGLTQVGGSPPDPSPALEQTPVPSGANPPAVANLGVHNPEQLPAHAAPGVFGPEAPSNFAGAKSWIILRCRYQSLFDGQSSKQSSKTFFETLYNNQRPNLGHYWSTVSYGKISIAATVAGNENEWRQLPHPNSEYATYNSSLFDRIAADCAGVWDADVNFANYGYVGFMLDQRIAGAAGIGGSFKLTRNDSGRDGKLWMAGEMEGSSHHSTALHGHEMGHAFNLPHSSSADGGWYNTPYDVLSAPGGMCNESRAEYACNASELLAHHKWWLLGWITDNRVYTATSGAPQQVTIERHADPASTSNPLLARIYLSAGWSYLVEVRMSNGANSYDKQIPGNGVVITKASTTEQYGTRWGYAMLQGTDDNNDGWWADGGTLWTPGETWTSPEGVTVTINSANTSSYTVTINTPIAPPGQATPAPTATATANPTPTATANPTPTSTAGGGQPRVSISGRTATEGDPTATARFKTFRFSVSLSAASSRTVTVVVSTADGTATSSLGAAAAPGDYTAKSATLTFLPGQTSKRFTVRVVRDNSREQNERFFVDLSAPTNATLGTSRGVGRINNDD